MRPRRPSAIAPPRRLTARYERQAASVLAFLHVACTLMGLRFLRRAEAG